jgi:D-alanyl-D-alanine dipeptidase
LRGTVVDRLVIAQSLLPRGLRLLILEGHRSADRVPADAGRRCGPSGTAPHRTGAAADLTMCDARGVGLDLGSAVPADRRILGMALSGAGLVNLPGAWWHWSFGDPYWALVSGARAAIYGPVEPTSTKD